MSAEYLTPARLNVFQEQVLSTTALCREQKPGCTGYSGGIRQDFSLGPLIFADEIVGGLVLDTDASRDLLRLSSQAEAIHCAQVLNAYLQALPGFSRSYVEYAPVKEKLEIVGKKSLFSRREALYHQVYVLRVSLSW